MIFAKRTNLRQLFAISIFVTLFAGIIWYLIQSYIEKTGEALLDGWVKSEAISIQEGNLLSALSKNKRMLLSSSFVKTVYLGDDQKQVEEQPETLIEFGDSISNGNIFRPMKEGQIESISFGLFEEFVSFRFQDQPNLFVSFVIAPTFAKPVFLSVVSILFAMTLLLIYFVSHSMQREQDKRFILIKNAIEQLLNQQPLSDDVVKEIPKLGDAWHGLRMELAKLRDEISSQAKFVAIAATTQNLAHDVRKPFSMLKMVLEAVSEADNPNESQEIAKASLPEVNQAMASVEGMIQDVMQIGSNSKPNQEVASPEAVIDAAVNELFRIFPESDVGIEYELNHTHCLFIDTMRVGRVFSNILVNAIQAMNSKGNLWIKTKEVGGLIEFRVGNVGSAIPKESLPKLFEAFFTSGKKGGTGLGLAIAQKVVNEHGGSIRCESEKTEKYPQGYVEFILIRFPEMSSYLNMKIIDSAKSFYSFFC